MSTPATLLLSEDRAWLGEAGGAVVRFGGIVLAECADVVAVLAHASLGLAELVLFDSRAVDLDDAAVRALRRHGVVVVAVTGGSISRPSIAGLPVFADVEAALAWAMERRTSLTMVAGRTGRGLTAVFGTRGAPGATTLSVALARALATDRAPIALMDLDPRGGCVAPHLGLSEDASVVVAADAMARRAPWRFSAETGSLAVLVAPRRPTWSHEVTAVEVGLLLDTVAEGRRVVVDAGSLCTEPDTIQLQVMARANQILLVARSDALGMSHLARSVPMVQSQARVINVVIDQSWGVPPGRLPAEVNPAATKVVRVRHAADVQPVVTALASGAEEQHQPGGGVEQHEHGHGHARRRLRRPR